MAERAQPRAGADQKYHGAVLVLAAGIATLLTAVLLIVLAGNPAPLNDGRYGENGQPVAAPFTSAILWLELAQSKAEVFQNLGHPGEAAGQELRARLDRMNLADYLFMLVYSAFNAALFLLVNSFNREGGRAFFGAPVYFNIGLALAAAMLLADAFENVPLLRFTEYAEPAAIPDGDMLWLMLATNAKWGALYLACVLLGMGYASYYGLRPAVLLGLLYSVAGVLGLMSLAVPAARPLLEPATNLMSLGWLISLIHAGFLVRAGRRQATA